MRSRVCGGLGLAGKGKKRACLHPGMLQELREGERLVFNTCTQTEQLKWTICKLQSNCLSITIKIYLCLTFPMNDKKEIDNFSLSPPRQNTGTTDGKRGAGWNADSCLSLGLQWKSQLLINVLPNRQYIFTHFCSFVFMEPIREN